MRDDDSLREGLGAALIGFFVLAVVVIIIVAGWQIGWWFKTNDAKRQGTIENINSHNLRKNFGYQQNLRDNITKNIGNTLDVSTQIAEDPSAAPQLKAQRAAIVNLVCGDAVQVQGDPLPASQAQFVQQNCQDGTISPTSKYHT